MTQHPTCILEQTGEEVHNEKLEELGQLLAALASTVTDLADTDEWTLTIDGEQATITPHWSDHEFADQQTYFDRE